MILKEIIGFVEEYPLIIKEYESKQIFLDERANGFNTKTREEVVEAHADRGLKWVYSNKDENIAVLLIDDSKPGEAIGC